MGYIKTEKNGNRIEVEMRNNENGNGTFYYKEDNESKYIEVDFDYCVSNIEVNLLGAVDEFDVELFECSSSNWDGDSVDASEDVLNELTELLHYTLDGWVEERID